VSARSRDLPPSCPAASAPADHLGSIDCIAVVLGASAVQPRVKAPPLHVVGRSSGFEVGQHGPMPSKAGQTAVVVPVPSAEPVVSVWRNRFDRSASQGMPAHITALYPFLPQERATGPVLATLKTICAQLPALDVVFRGAARFPGVLYLDPEPADELRRLTAAIAGRWPQAPPYGGAFEEVIPHLTVAHGVQDSVLAEIEIDVVRGLPLSARLVEACLYVFDGARWCPRAQLPFLGHPGRV
jgi:2'-5' RNA ligase